MHNSRRDPIFQHQVFTFLPVLLEAELLVWSCFLLFPLEVVPAACGDTQLKARHCFWQCSFSLILDHWVSVQGTVQAQRQRLARPQLSWVLVT